jgi:hypothetical protein
VPGKEVFVNGRTLFGFGGFSFSIRWHKLVHAWRELAAFAGYRLKNEVRSFTGHLPLFTYAGPEPAFFQWPGGAVAPLFTS